MYKPTLAALAVAALASAQETTTNLFLVGFTSQSIVGSIITSDSAATTYLLQCGDSSNCGGPGGLPETGLTFVQGPETMHYSYVTEDTGITETISLGCTITSSLSGTCFGSGVADIAGSTTTITGTTTTFTDGGSALGGQDVTLTAGALLTISAAPSTTVSTDSTGSTMTSTPSGKTAKTASTSSGASAATQSGSSSSSSSSKAAAPMITQAPWLVAGAAAALAYAAL